jgi:hypothetical protein
MNNGVIYENTADLTLNLTVFGLLGKESSSITGSFISASNGSSFSAPTANEQTVTITTSGTQFASTLVGNWVWFSGTSNGNNGKAAKCTAYISPTQIKVYNPSGVAESGTAFTWGNNYEHWYVYAVPDTTVGNEGKYSLIASRNPPEYRYTPNSINMDPGVTTGPSDYSVWSYIGCLFFYKSPQTLRKLIQTGDRFRYADGSENYAYVNGTGSLTSAGPYGLWLTGAFVSGINRYDGFLLHPIHAASEVLIAAAMDADATGTFGIIVYDSMSAWTPGGSPHSRWIATCKNNDVAHGRDWVICPSGAFRVYWAYASSTEQIDIRPQGYRDRFLTGRV